jgi:hypothetical protein
MTGEMNSKEIEEGGSWYEARLELEEIAKALGSDSIKVVPFDQYQGPCCLVSKGNIDARIWLAEDDKYLLENEYSQKNTIFYKEEANEEIWEKIK